MPGFHHSVAVLPLPFPYTVAVTAAVCLASSASMIGWPATERNNGKIELDPISAEERLQQLFVVYSCNGTEFSYVIFTEQRNFTTAERRNGNERTATEWWKPGITSGLRRVQQTMPQCTLHSYTSSYDINISLGSVATRLRRGGIFSDRFIADFLECADKKNFATLLVFGVKSYCGHRRSSASRRIDDA